MPENYRSPINLALTGVVLIIAGMAVESLIPRIANIGHFVQSVGWVAIVVAVILFLIDLVRGAAR